MFGVGVFAYLITVMQRSTLGVAAVDATERFQIDAAALSTLAVAQLIAFLSYQTRLVAGLRALREAAGSGSATASTETAA